MPSENMIQSNCSGKEKDSTHANGLVLEGIVHMNSESGSVEKENGNIGEDTEYKTDLEGGFLGENGHLAGAEESVREEKKDLSVVDGSLLEEKGRMVAMTSPLGQDTITATQTHKPITSLKASRRSRRSSKNGDKSNSTNQANRRSGRKSLKKSLSKCDGSIPASVADAGIASGMDAHGERDDSKIAREDGIQKSSGEQQNSSYHLIQSKGQIEHIRVQGGPHDDVDESTIYVGNLPEDVNVEELTNLFGEIGSVESARIMLNPVNNKRKGYGFVAFTSAADVQRAKDQFINHEIRPNRVLIVGSALQNRRLFVGNVSKKKSKDDLFREFSSLTEGLIEVIIYKGIRDVNRGFCFLEYESRRKASMAKNRLHHKGSTHLRRNVLVDWADPAPQPSQEVMATVKRVYVGNLAQKTSEGDLRALFEEFGTVDRVRKIKSYAFVHFEERHSALRAIREMNERVVDGEVLHVVLSKPPVSKEIQQQVLQSRGKRLVNQKIFGYQQQRYSSNCPSTQARGERGGRSNISPSSSSSSSHSNVDFCSAPRASRQCPIENNFQQSSMAAFVGSGCEDCSQQVKYECSCYCVSCQSSPRCAFGCHIKSAGKQAYLQ